MRVRRSRSTCDKLLDDFFGKHPAAFLEPALKALAVEVHSAFVAGQHVYYIVFSRVAFIIL